MFDIDGTLTQSNDLDDEAFLKALFEVFGLSEISNDWLSYTHVTDACILKEVCQCQLGRTPSLDEVSRFQTRLLELLTQGAATRGGIQPISGASSILSRLLASSDHCVAYAGGAWTASALFKIQSAHLPVQGIPYAFSDDDESREGITAIALTRAEQQYGRTFSSVVYVGDGIWDVRSARNSGYQFVGIASGDDAQLLRDEGASLIFPNYDDPECFLAALSAIA
ncbi:HAD family hydrolase [Pseudanabaenaceae cyanobacterium LEGE 13415]|nr:HAD family hydrolase [Pseudanabaenaceae cyanobacterium LEGE 13415]